jgi:hypothetical protein
MAELIRSQYEDISSLLFKDIVEAIQSVAYFKFEFH